MATTYIDAKIEEVIKDSSGSIVFFNYVCPCCQKEVEAEAFFNEKNSTRMDSAWGFCYECKECKSELFLSIADGGKDHEI